MIAIKDMEMPKNCGSCVMRVGKCKERIYMENRPDRCPLIEIKTDGDTISRQAAIDAVIEWYGCEPSDMDYFVKILAKKPSAQPERKKGLWIKLENRFGNFRCECSNCKSEHTVLTATDHTTGISRLMWSYCPICGAKMEGVDEAY